VRCSTPVSSLQQETGGAVTGAATKDGVLTARKTILAAGGFGASAELLARYIPKALDIPFPGHHRSRNTFLVGSGQRAQF
jgi:glycine/D-amino acid oxidase-like deaminating enzyme